LTVPTARTHVQIILAKMGCHDRTSAVAQAMKRGLLDT
jgi:DNA-binding NarL/FixJ family response regulator